MQLKDSYIIEISHTTLHKVKEKQFSKHFSRFVFNKYCWYLTAIFW